MCETHKQNLTFLILLNKTNSDLMRSPDGKSQREDDGGKGIGSSGNDEETEDGSTMCTVERRQGTEVRWRRDTRCCAQDEMVGSMVLVSS